MEITMPIRSQLPWKTSWYRRNGINRALNDNQNIQLSRQDKRGASFTSMPGNLSYFLWYSISSSWRKHQELVWKSIFRISCKPFLCRNRRESWLLLHQFPRVFCSLEWSECKHWPEVVDTWPVTWTWVVNCRWWSTIRFVPPSYRFLGKKLEPRIDASPRLTFVFERLYTKIETFGTRQEMVFENWKIALLGKFDWILVFGFGEASSLREKQQRCWIRIFQILLQRLDNLLWVFVKVSFQEGQLGKDPAPANDWNPSEWFLYEWLGQLKNQWDFAVFQQSLTARLLNLSMASQAIIQSIS